MNAWSLAIGNLERVPVIENPDAIERAKIAGQLKSGKELAQLNRDFIHKLIVAHGPINTLELAEKSLLRQETALVHAKALMAEGKVRRIGGSKYIYYIDASKEVEQ